MFLAGCVTEEKYIKKLDSWMGRSSADLVREWGKPKTIETLDDHQFFVFYTKYIEYIAPTPISTGSFNHKTGVYTPDAFSTYNDFGSTTERPCKTTFEIANDKVVKWWFTGDGCISR